jgi:peptide/nickel transport system permease protein
MKRAVFGALFVFVAVLLAPSVAPQQPYDLAGLEWLDARLAPGATGVSGVTYWLGTDEHGRDLLSAILHGLRVSVLVALAATLAALTFGMAIGLLAASAGGRADDVLMRIVDLQLSFPAILIALVLLAALGTGLDKIVVALVAAQWAYYARTTRGIALVEMQKTYVLAARALGLAGFAVAVRHILPNCLPALLVVATAQVAHAIALEATLSFLGLGVPITEPTLGLLVANGYPHLLAGRYWISVFPGVALVLALIALHAAGESLRRQLGARDP